MIFKWTLFSVFMWRNHIPNLNNIITFPSEFLLLSDKRPYRYLTFQNVLARQGCSYWNKARLNFQAFALRGMKIATREVKRWVITLVFANWTALALEETFLSMCQSSRAIILRFNSKTQWQMFLLLYGRHVCVPLTFKSDETLMCDHSNESYWAVLSCATVYYAVQGGSNF